MKKIKFIIISLAIMLLTAGCIKQDSYEDITIYTTVYPIEYITNYLYGEYSEIKSIYPSNVNLDEYKVTAKQIKDYAKGDLFIYNGLTNEKDIAADIINKNKNTDIIDISRGLEIQNHVTELWLSPTNFLMLTSNIKNSLKDLITSTALLESIDSKYDDLKVKISEMDAELKIIAENANNKKIYVTDNTFKFLNKYGFEVISISSEDENSNTNYSRAKKAFETKENKYLFTLSDTKENDQINELVKSGAEVLKVPNMYTISEEQRKNNIDYISLMENLIENFKTEVY